MATGERHRIRHLFWQLPDGERDIVANKEIILSYVDRWTSAQVNIRVQPNKLVTPVKLLSPNVHLRVIDQPVTPELLLLKQMNYPIDPNYEWHYIVEGEFAGRFIAGSFLKDAPAPQPSPSPAPSPAPSPGTINPPAPLNGLKGLTLQTVGGKTFLRGGQYMGVNLRECIYWGHPQIAPYMSQGDWEKYFRWLALENIRWVRCYVLNLNASIEDTEARMQAMLDVAKIHGIRICAVFMDSIGMELDTGAKHRFNLKSLRPFHTGPLEHLIKEFYLRNLWGEMLPYIIRIVNRFKDHKALCMWQILNEGAIYPQPATQADSEAFQRMIYTISKEIYERDKSTPIADGCISPHVHAPQGVDIRTYAESYYNRNPYIHVATFHVYQDREKPGGLGAGEGYVLAAMEAAQATRRATGYTEFGAKVDRLTWLRGLINRAIVEGDASFLFQWALELDPPYNKGIGDNDWGWGNKNFNDFDALKIAYREAGENLRAR